MKKYSDHIQKLYESTGYERIDAGSTYNTQRGHRVVVKEIYIDATLENPEVLVTFDLEKTDGSVEAMTESFTTVVDLIRKN